MPAPCLGAASDVQGDRADELGISANTVSGYIGEAVELLGARDRRDAARRVFGAAPRTIVGGETSWVTNEHPTGASDQLSTEAPPATDPWPDPRRSRNTLSPGRTLIAIVAVTFISIAALALIIGMARGMGGVAYLVLTAFDRLTR